MNALISPVAPFGELDGLKKLPANPADIPETAEVPEHPAASPFLTTAVNETAVTVLGEGNSRPKASPVAPALSVVAEYARRKRCSR